MIEYYGWASIRESFDETHENDELMEKIWQEFQQKVIATFDGNSNPQFKLGIMNANYQFIISGFHNHKSQEFFNVIALFEWLAENALGSYGLLYYFDDEDNNGFANEFQVYSLKKGKFERQKDTFLSPYFDEIEENNEF